MTNVLKLLKQYNEAEEKLHEYFGFRPQWRVIPLADETKSYWFLDTDKVVYSDKPFTKKLIELEKYYEAELYPEMEDGEEAVLRKNAYTMMIVDTNNDANVFLMIFDNTKELKDKNLIKAYHCANDSWEARPKI